MTRELEKQSWVLYSRSWWAYTNNLLELPYAQCTLKSCYRLFSVSCNLLSRGRFTVIFLWHFILLVKDFTVLKAVNFLGNSDFRLSCKLESDPKNGHQATVSRGRILGRNWDKNLQSRGGTLNIFLFKYWVTNATLLIYYFTDWCWYEYILHTVIVLGVPWWLYSERVAMP